MSKRYRKLNPAIEELERLVEIYTDENGEADLTVCGPIHEGMTQWYDTNPPDGQASRLAEQLIERWKQGKKLSGRNGQRPLFEWDAILTLGDGRICKAGEATYDQCQRQTLVLTREHNTSTAAYLGNMEYWQERMEKFRAGDTLGAVEIREFDYVRSEEGEEYDDN